MNGWTTSTFTFWASLLLCSLSWRHVSAVNWILVQVDDFNFLEFWDSTPPHFSNQNQRNRPLPNRIPNIEKLRTQGLEMMQAHTASPMCGTSRYTTMTGRYASRSSRSRLFNQNQQVSEVTIPLTKLLDTGNVPNGNDCSRNNMAQEFQRGGYKTAMIGKWHLSFWSDFDYPELVRTVQNCGFDHAASVYPHNPVGSWSKKYGYQITHNQEYMTGEAIKFINDNKDEDFFMYFNPTVPHVSSDVSSVLQSGNCQQTVAGPQGTPVIKDSNGNNIMSGNCRAYRQSVINRASSLNDKELGSIWVDDAIGHLFTALDDNGILDDTCFVFQMDHGQEGKGTLFDQGIRIAQFIYCPPLNIRGSFDGLVSTIDTAPSLLQLSGITPSYQMDGQSWANAIFSTSSTLQSWKDRCIVAELQYDRVVKCGCKVYMELSTNRESWTRTQPLFSTSNRPVLSGGSQQFYDVCNLSDEPYYSPAANPQAQGGVLVNSQPQRVGQFKQYMDCFKRRTNPNTVPDYSQCVLPELNGPPSNPNPPGNPGYDCVGPDPETVILPNGQTRLCGPWFLAVPQRCNNPNLNVLCPHTCGLCPDDPSPPANPNPPSPPANPNPASGENYDCSQPDPLPPARVTLPRGFRTTCGSWFTDEEYRCEDYGYLCPHMCGWCPDDSPQNPPEVPNPPQNPPEVPNPPPNPPASPSCADSELPFQLKLYPGETRTCRWVQAAPPNSNFRRNRCNNYGDLCPVTCNQCDD